MMPKVKVITPSGTFLGTTYQLSFCINKDHSIIKPGKKAIFIGRTKRTIDTDSIPGHSMLKQVYSQTLTDALWPIIANGKAYSAVSNEKLSAAMIAEGNIPGMATINIPRYDSLGNFIGNTSYASVKPAELNKIELVQDWYYDPNKDIIICNIPEIYFYKRQAADDPGKEEKALIKIVF